MACVELGHLDRLTRGVRFLARRRQRHRPEVVDSGGVRLRNALAQLPDDVGQHRAGVVLYHTYGFGRSQREQSTPSISSQGDVGGTGDDMNLTIGIGLLAGLNRHTPDHTLKLSLEVDF